ncbi:hypothetical protein SO802_029020 [Lithocarpus litseifolius]|uniref:Uncharacterized protein n=1 Tax=Lithocarpus litseifolius TaxID=425828 RepID=A0AAW2BTW3_9ROSI
MRIKKQTKKCMKLLRKIESKKNRDHRSKQDDLHTVGSCRYVVHAAKKAKVDGRLVERAALYSILHTYKDGSTVNPVVQGKMDQLQSSDPSGSIAWSLDNVFAKVMGKERKCRIRGVGFVQAQVAEVASVLSRTFKYNHVKQGMTKMHN